MFGLAALAAVAAMAFLGASSASATSSALCVLHEEPCLTKHQLELAKAENPKENVISSVHMTAGITTLQTSVAKVLCLSSLAQGTVGALGSPQKVTIAASGLTWSNCGTNAAHTNCIVTTLEGGTIDLLKTALNLGTGTILGSEVLVACDLLIDIHCVYGGEVEGFGLEGAGHTASAGNGMFNANAVEVKRIKGAFCPEESKWTALFEPLTALYGTS